MWFVSPWMQVGCGFAFIRYSIKAHFKNYPLSHPRTFSTGLVSKPPFSSDNLELLSSSGAALMILCFLGRISSAVSVAINTIYILLRKASQTPCSSLSPSTAPLYMPSPYDDWFAGCAVRNRVTSTDRIAHHCPRLSKAIDGAPAGTTRLRPGHKTTMEDNGTGFALFAATEMED
jgi:hypothetical protein